MQLLFEFLPLILFFAAYKYRDMYFALAVLMIAAPIGLGLKYLMTRKLDRMYFWSTVLLLIAGSATIYFQNPQFIFWKPTVLYWAAALVFLGSIWIGEKPLTRRMYDAIGEFPTEQLSKTTWVWFTLVWVGFLTLMGLANVYVAYNFPEPTWVSFKVYGLFGATFVFTLAQTIWLVSRLDFPDEDAEESS